jgi:hypothetical protein
MEQKPAFPRERSAEIKHVESDFKASKQRIKRREQVNF